MAQALADKGKGLDIIAASALGQRGNVWELSHAGILAPRSLLQDGESQTLLALPKPLTHSLRRPFGGDLDAAHPAVLG